MIIKITSETIEDQEKVPDLLNAIMEATDGLELEIQGDTFVRHYYKREEVNMKV